MSLVDEYRKLAGGYGRVFRQDQCEVFCAVLADFSAVEVSRAVVQWQGQTEYDERADRPRGAEFPLPADLKLLIMSQRAQSNGPRFTPCGRCDDGWVRLYHGRTAGGNEVDSKVGAVRRCGCRKDFIKATR